LVGFLERIGLRSSRWLAPILFSWMVTWRAFNVEKKSLSKKIAFSFVAWFFILVVTTAYHLGYSDFRSPKIVQPNIGNTIISLPTLISVNPIGAPITHAMMHIAAIIIFQNRPFFTSPQRLKSLKNTIFKSDL